MRFSRLVIGVLVICAAIWVIVNEQLAGASADAVLNAQVISVTTPIAGVVKDFDRGLGAAISPGDPLGAVVDERVDSVRLDDLSLQRDLVNIQLERLRGQLQALQPAGAMLNSRTADYSLYSMQALQVSLAEAEERLRILDLPEGEPDLIQMSRAREEVGRLRAMVAAAEKGVFIAGGYNDAPFSEQRSLDQAAELARLTAEIEATTAELTAIDRRIDQERIRVGRAATAAITSPVEGIIWERLATSGVHVQRGDAVLHVADCESAFVTLSVTQSVYNRLTPGTPATFRFDGSGEILTGTVARLAGTSASSFYGSLAVAPSQRHLERADVLLTLPDLRSHPDLKCAIGRTGRAFFEVRPLDWLRAYFR